jgi:N,N'-diacetyllegionaminate synthase
MGDMRLAQEMTLAAAKSGADIVKFQTWKVNNLKSGPWDTDGRRQIYEKAELSREMHRDLRDLCSSAGVRFMTSCFSSRDVEEVRQLSSIIKVPSTELTNRELLSEICRLFVGDPDHHIYVSTGASIWSEVMSAADVLRESGVSFTLLHCVSSYPCPAESCNMPRIKTLSEISESVGYSGHYPGIEDALVAIEMGVACVEKHFTTDQTLPGRDNKFALLPGDFARIREFEAARKSMLSYHGKDHLECERDMRQNYRGRWDKRD